MDCVSGSLGVRVEHRDRVLAIFATFGPSLAPIVGFSES